MKKRCSRCKEIKDVIEFHKNKNEKGGLSYICKSCKKIDDKMRQQKRILNGRCPTCGRSKVDNKKYTCDICLKNMKKNRHLPTKKEKRKKYLREYNRKRKLIDIKYKLSCNLRSRLYKTLRGNYKVGSSIRDLGCSIEELKVYLENQFQLGMTWDNWGKGENDWQLDHIKPLHIFDLTNREQFLEACHYTNLRPLWKKDNLSRTYEEFNDN